MKLLYVVPPTTHFAGIEHVVHGIASGLANEYAGEIDVTVLYCGRYAEVEGELPYRMIVEEVARLRNYPTRVGRWLSRTNYDFVVVAQYEATALLWLYHRLHGGKSRFVMHLHGNPKVESHGSLRARLAFLFFNPIASRMEKVLAVSPGLARYLKQVVRKPDLVQYVPNPVRQFSDVSPAVRAKPPVCYVSIGRLARQKGHDVLIRAFAKVRDAGVYAQLTIVGGGDELDPLKALIDELKLEGHVHLVGKIDNPANELASADCFVSASRWEGFGVAIVEALSAGLYVIATDCEFGPSDVIDAPEKGTIVPAEDPDQLAKAMIAFARSDRGTLHRQLRRDAASEFRLERVVFRHAAILQSLAKGKHERA